MGQLGTLLWKNFQFCRRHYVKTLLFYAIPLFFCCFLLLTLALLPISDVGDCEFQTFALPPSSPAGLLSSLVCAEREACGEWGAYAEPSRFKDGLVAGSRLCLDANASRKLLGKRAASLCEDRDGDADYEGLQQTDLIFRGLLYYTPQNAVTDALMIKIASYFDKLETLRAVSGGLSQYAGSLPLSYSNDDLTSIAGGLDEIAGATACYKNLLARISSFDSVESATEAAQKTDFAKTGVWGIIEFNATGNDFVYKINTHYNLRTQLSTLYLQAAVEAAVIETKTGTQLGNIATKLLPRRCHKDDAIYGPGYSAIMFVVGLGFIMVSYSVTSEICAEKASGLLEFLFIAGVGRWKTKLGWFLFGATFFLSIAVLVGLVFKFSSARLLEHTSLLFLLGVLCLFSLALLCMCFLVSSLMGTPQSAAILIFVSQLGAYLIPSWLGFVPSVGYTGGTLISVRVLGLLHSTVAAELAFAYIFAWESVNQSPGGSNIGSSPVDGDGFGGLAECIVYLIIQIPLYLLLSAYFDHTAPSKYGLKWPPYFCCLPSFWGCGAKPDADGEEEADKAKAADVEMLGDSKPVGIHLRNLNKLYAKDKKAVDQLSVDFYDKEITALLGHNGAGKSTTMNMLTGMISPSSGRAEIGGRSIWDHMGQIRRTLGFCPQYDIVYPELSVKDHMRFYGNLKGIPPKEVEAYYNDIFTQMKMMAALDTPAAALSGGMKRKLSIAVALLGNPSVIILDEPTSAIDPFSRRAIWDVILRYRNTATVLISTHYMQEADVLGDRIAIIDKGSLKCAGSPMYLKARYGSGFKLILAHQKTIDATGLRDKLKVFTPLVLASSSATETVFDVALEAAHSIDMIAVFEYLESHKTDIGIASFGISESTMEQVFFKVAEGDQMKMDDNSAADKKALFDGINYKHVEGPALVLQQTMAMWLKRLHLARKSFLVFVFQVLAPLLFAIFLLFFKKTIASNDSLSTDAKTMHMWELQPSQLTFYAGTTGSPLAGALVDRGFGQKCIGSGRLRNSDGGALNCLTSSAVFPAVVASNSNGKECTCDTCPADASDPQPKEATLLSNDTIMNLSGRNVTAFLIKHTRTENMYGGLEEKTVTLSTAGNFFETFGANVASAVSGAPSPLWKELDDILKAAPGGETMVWTGIKEGRGRKQTKREQQMRSAPAAFLNAANNVILRARLGVADKRAYGITVMTEELSLTDDVSRAAVISGIIMGFFGALALLMPTFNVILVIVNENSSGNKRLQLVMGLHPVVYWVANFLWDGVLFMLSLAIMTAFMATFPADFNIKLSVFFLTGLVYGLCMILFCYVLSFVMKTARITILLVGNVAPFFSIAAMILMGFSAKSWYEVVNAALNFFPPYFLTDSIAIVSMQDALPAFVREPLLSWDNLGKRYTMAGLFAFVMLVLLVCFEAGMFRALGDCCRGCCAVMSASKVADAAASSAEEDPDVMNEERRILEPSQSTEARKDVLSVHQLSKVYSGRKVAVKGVSFGVYEGECFGLLGVNGAGKTTLFKMLAGFHPPTKGDARVQGHSIFSETRAVAKRMSYCPQEDVLYPQLTPEEHLALYGRIRGIPGTARKELCDALMETVGLSPHAGKQSQALSGGNKRKLNFALAVLDWPACIFLDEMTTGMDPKARRAAWECLELAIGRGCAVVITSHSMEECEALCNRLVIMVNGRFNCIGGVQYLKDRFGNNYNVKMRLGPASDADAIRADFLRDFAAQEPRLVEEHVGFLEFQVAAEALQLSQLFRTLHAMKESRGLDEFTASQTTLEHVFVNMVKDQE